MATQFGVKAKKGLGQHFLVDESIAKGIVDSLIIGDSLQVLEIGPGTGVLTKYLLADSRIKLEVCEIDTESIEYLQKTYPQMLYSLQQRDFLTTPLEKIFNGEYAVIGNFPYNISSQIFFRILDYRESVPQVVCMLQKEVAERLASGPGNKSYGILSVLLQAWYNIEYLFTVPEHVFVPPPKVKSGAIRLTRNSRTSLGCDEVLFKKVVKTCFNQRRKTIRNSIKPILAETGKNFTPENTPEQLSRLFELRPEQLSVERFVELTLLIS
ncbi:MAG: 16S rRNA (adenine(1518)-N(6)/adenine(1519)-N(6))-dimethyltransferase RsmA [Bacteroidales bacterium]|nr:16S rRNA (adenine(1518)-N(6)/adenine(1519)-N(6))-dimethyltransferase RsmA [Bacteroidales bacterium]